MGRNYGYQERPDQPGRRTPPQAAPLSALPRKVTHAVKHAREVAALQQILMLYQCDATALNFITGITPVSTSEGGAGTTTITNEYWWSEISRFCRYIEIAQTAGAGAKRINRTELQLDISPLAVLDPSKPEAPFIWRFEDICAARLVSPAAGHIGAFHFGLTWENALGVALAAPKPFIGIYANWTGTAYGTWTARCVDDSGSGLDQNLGVTTESPHRLAYAIDGRGQVVFSIDGVDLYTYTTTGSDLGTNAAFQVSHRWTVAADSSATIRGGYMMDLQTVVSAEVLDEVA